ncbi:TIR domain-containing protein [Anatilimnocola sp. NA78]|uniref:TIR domain-containing protein n=1 Tax=Anatilimnocola sp. NA78 TaxID=3415683 RepID=UPI003CE4FD1A
MSRRAFYSFHYQPDCWRAATVRSIGSIEGNRPAEDNDWESIKKGGDAAIQSWIDGQLFGKSCAVVLIGANTAGRKWINYEIEKAWREKKGLLGIYIHNLKDSKGDQSSKGTNPFSSFNIGSTPLSSIVQTYDPPFWDSKEVYKYITDNLAEWFDQSLAIRARY